MATKIIFLAVLCLGGSCTCERLPLQQLAPAVIVVEPTELMLPRVFLGQPASATFQVRNDGEATAKLTITVDAPFQVSPTSIALTRGAEEQVAVSFASEAVGVFSGTVRVGEAPVAVTVEVAPAPACRATSSCQLAAFDFGLGRCVESTKPDGAACESPCVVNGQCSAGTCTGINKNCDDANACTVDACNTNGDCVHVARDCGKVSNVCTVTNCEPATGCGSTPVFDGTLCDADDCTQQNVNVCIVGSCVSRRRPNSGRCSNTWVPLTMPPRFGHSMVHDVARQRLVVFGGLGTGGVNRLADTWEFDGLKWRYRTPPASPSARFAHSMAYDVARGRVVLFGGSGVGGTVLGDTWEWDGTTWIERQLTQSPPPRSLSAMAYDSTRSQMVLFGGESSSKAPLADTWVFDGLSWSPRQGPVNPPASTGHAIAFDSARARAVLHGPNPLGTWEWDGLSWSPRPMSVSPPAPFHFAREVAFLSSMTFDPLANRVVLTTRRSSTATEAWEWDGLNWSRSAKDLPTGVFGQAMAFDTARQRVTLTGGTPTTDNNPSAATWVRTGGAWQSVSSGTTGPPVSAQQVVFDSTSQAFLAVANGKQWSGDGSSWVATTLGPVAPRAGFSSRIVFDTKRKRAVLYGGFDFSSASFTNETWEWDGADWALHSPVESPRAGGNGDNCLTYDSVRGRTVLVAACTTWEWDGSSWLERGTGPCGQYAESAFDAARGRTVLWGGMTESETWEWDGVEWLNRAPVVSPGRRLRPALGYDANRQLTLMFGGTGPNDAGLLTDKNDTWEWDGSSWVKRAPLVSPAVPGDAALVYDPVRQRMLLIGSSESWMFLP